MGGYVKLFSDIVESSIWDEDSDTCKVWITLLALSDQDGYVRGSVGWLADKARVPVDSCRHALEAFAQPDLRSRTPDHDGRRIENLEDGWLILNYIEFRNRLSTDKAATSSRERVRRHRERYRALQALQGVTPENTASASASESEEDWYDDRYELPGYSAKDDRLMVLSELDQERLSEAVRICGSVSAGRSNALHHELVAAFQKANRKTTVEWVIKDRGDGHGGRIDIVVDGTIAIEADGMRPKKKSVMKLRTFQGLRIIVLAGGKWEGKIDGIHAIVSANTAQPDGDSTLPTLKDFRAAAEGLAIPPEVVEACFNYYAATDFMRGQTRLRNWKSLLASWWARERERSAMGKSEPREKINPVNVR
jgi:hypothetical protein